MKRIKRLLPSSLAGRITLILTMGFFSAQSIAVWLLVHDRTVTAMKIFGLSVADRVVTIIDVMETLPPDEQVKLLQALHNPRFQVSVLDQPPSQSQREAWHADEIRQDVRSHLIPQLSQPIQIQVLDRWSNSPLLDQSDGSALVPLLSSRQTMVIVVQQTRDRWLVFVTPSDIISLRSSSHRWFVFLFIGLAIWLLSLWAARRVTQPITQFATAAEQFGRDINAPPLPEAGSRELRQSIQAFNQMQERLRHLVNERTFMLAAIAHDLRTILTRLKLRAEFIDDGEQAQKAIADIDQMQTMLTETLTFARAESTTEAFVKLDLASLLQSLCDDVVDTGKKAIYQGPVHVTYVGQPTALHRAFMNLIHNAVTYGNEAEVMLRSKQERLEVVICDRGFGIPPEFQDKIFEPFFRLEQSRNRETGGTGLGLAVAQTIIQRHSGTIQVQSQLNSGSTFTITLPTV